jgi:ElaA protein
LALTIDFYAGWAGWSDCRNIIETVEDSITWSWWKLADAEPLALFAYLRLRSDVFVVEQSCVYPDMDDHDLVAWHLTGTDASGRLLGAARLLPPGEKFQEQAQAYLERFYGSHGFQPEGEVYLEDGIPHIDMTLQP